MESFKAGDRVVHPKSIEVVREVKDGFALFESGGWWAVSSMRAGGWAVIPNAAPRLTDEQQQRAYDTAKHVMGHDNTSAREEQLAQGLIDARGEADRLGSLLDAVRGFIAKHTATGADDHRSTLADVARFIAEHRSAK